VADWSFLTNHARVLLCIAHDPGARVRGIAARTGITERTAYGIVTDFTEAGYVVKHKDGRRNRYQIQATCRSPRPAAGERTLGEILALLAGEDQPGTGLPRPADRQTSAPSPLGTAGGPSSAAADRRSVAPER
jgi:hypothetical protein